MRPCSFSFPPASDPPASLTQPSCASPGKAQESQKEDVELLLDMYKSAPAEQREGSSLGGSGTQGQG